mmetsp:Transcript_5543/g.7844  ORF Transcript_5543/g.7844 Transcript_5543/m.7844 type:complete len:82 (+) Transcript_5543:176-421(+)
MDCQEMSPGTCSKSLDPRQTPSSRKAKTQQMRPDEVHMNLDTLANRQGRLDENVLHHAVQGATCDWRPSQPQKTGEDLSKC